MAELKEITITMNNIKDILERFYNNFINQEQGGYFFIGLADYLNYVLETPILSGLVFKVIEKRDEEYEKLESLEKKSFEELESAKTKLLKIIEENKIDTYAIKPIFPFLANINIVEELKMFEKDRKELNYSGHLIGQFNQYLFNIAKGISEQGHKDKLAEFTLSEKEYTEHHNEPQNGVYFGNNIYGNFVFSKTLKFKRKQEEYIENARKSELWSVFDELLKFNRAFTEKRKNRYSFEFLNNETAATNKEVRDNVDITYMIEDLDKINGVKNNNILSDGIYKLNRSEFKNYATRTNTFLLNELVKTENKILENKEEQDKFKIKFNSLVGTLRYGDITHSFHKGRNGDDLRLSLFKKLWEEKRFIKKGVEQIKGKSLQPAFLAVQLNMTSDASTFARNKNVQERFFGIIKGINRILKNKKFPAYIERKGGIQFVINEK